MKRRSIAGTMEAAIQETEAAIQETEAKTVIQAVEAETAAAADTMEDTMAGTTANKCTETGIQE